MTSENQVTAATAEFPRWKWMLCLIVGFGLLIRVWGTWYGLPFSYWVDEYHEVMRALELGSGSFNFVRTTKGGFYYVLFVEYGLYYVFLKLMGIVATANEFAEMFARNPSAFYLMGRLTAVLAGTMTIVVVFILGRRAFRTSAGLFAALFLAVNFLHIDLSRRIGVDVPMAMLATFALYFGLRIVEDGRRLHYILAALFAALATTTKLPGVLVLLSLLVAHTYHVAQTVGGVRRWIGSRELWLAVGVFILVLVATNPGILMHAGYLSIFLDTSTEVPDESAVASVAHFASGNRPNLFAYYLMVLKDSMGWPLFILGLISAGYALWKRTPADVMLLTYGLANYLVISSTSSETLFYPRYSLPVIVVLAVLSGRVLGDFARMIPRYRAFVTAIAVAACIAWPFADSLATARALARTDTRTQALRWFEANVPTDSKVLIEGGKIGTLRATVPLRDSRQSMKRRISYWKSKEPRQARFLELQLAVHEGGGYELELVRLSSIGGLDDFSAKRIEYIVVRPDYFMGSRRADGSSAHLLSELRSDSRVTLVRRFQGDTPTQLGPTIEIYRMQASPAAPAG